MKCLSHNQKKKKKKEASFHYYMEKNVLFYSLMIYFFFQIYQVLFPLPGNFFLNFFSRQCTKQLPITFHHSMNSDKSSKPQNFFKSGQRLITSKFQNHILSRTHESSHQNKIHYFFCLFSLMILNPLIVIFLSFSICFFPTLLILKFPID